MISADLRSILENFENMLQVVIKRFRVVRLAVIVVKTVEYKIKRVAQVITITAIEQVA